MDKYLCKIWFWNKYNQNVILTKNITYLALRNCHIIHFELLNVTHVAFWTDGYIVDNLSNNIKYIDLGSDFTMGLNNVPNSVKEFAPHLHP